MNPLDYLDTLIVAQSNYQQGKSELPVQLTELQMLRMFMENALKNKQ